MRGCFQNRLMSFEEEDFKIVGNNSTAFGNNFGIRPFPNLFRRLALSLFRADFGDFREIAVPNSVQHAHENSTGITDPS